MISLVDYFSSPSQKKLDLAKVLSFPLTEVPLSLCHITGTVNKTDKSSLMKKLEGMGQMNTEPSCVDVYIIDAMFFLRTLVDIPSNFGQLARLILQKAISFARTVHIVCDTYKEGPSIKAHVHEERGDTEVQYTITGPSQKRPADFNKALLSSAFKTALLRFLQVEWKSASYSDILTEHTVYFAIDDVCFRYSIEHGKYVCQEVPELRSQHEEADTRIVFHADFVEKEQQSKTIAVRSCDTDVFILLIHHAMNMEASIWMDTGLSARNNRRHINVTDLASTLTPPVCASLPSFHAFTGCDYTAAFLRKAKTRPYALMISNEKYISAFIELGSSEIVEPTVCDVLEDFVCSMYGAHGEADVNSARLSIFKKMYSPPNKNSPLAKIKTADACCLPPCKNALYLKIKRANYVARMWKGARNSNPTTSTPQGHGWALSEENSLEFVWYTCPKTPDLFGKDTEEDHEHDDVGEDDDEENPNCIVSSDEESDDNLA